jgi:hypothetical protein
MRFLAGLALLLHAGVHLAIWLPAYDPERREHDARRSWILAAEQIEPVVIERTAIWGSVLCASLFALSGSAFFLGFGWADEAAAAGAVLSIMLALLYFFPWLASFLVVNLAILTLAL